MDDDNYDVYDYLPEDYYDDDYIGPVYDFEDLQEYHNELSSNYDETPDGFIFGED